MNSTLLNTHTRRGASTISCSALAGAAAVFDPRGKYRETQCPTAGAAASPLAAFDADLPRLAAGRGARARAALCLRSTPPQYSHRAQAAEKNYCLSVQTSRACRLQFCAAKRISSTPRARRPPRCCDGRGRGARLPALPSLRAATASDLVRATCVFYRLHRAGRERDRRNPRRVLPRAKNVHAETLPEWRSGRIDVNELVSCGVYPSLTPCACAAFCACTSADLRLRAVPALCARL